MILVKDNLTLRDAAPGDAERLCEWWNDGKVMAHAGFPMGLNETPERVRESLQKDAGRHIIELSGSPIGEMNFRNTGDATAEIGIKICDFEKQEKGYGTLLLSMFIDALFAYSGYEKIVLDTNVKNLRAQYVYGQKLGFRKLGVRENDWQDQLGEWQSSVDFELEKADWKPRPEYVRLRPEEEADERQVENLTREAFWINTDQRPFIDEHLLVRKLRRASAFLRPLNYVAEIGGKLAGNVMYSRAKIVPQNGQEREVITFGPLSVLPEFQGRGVGRALMTFTIAEARRQGHRAIVFFGHPDYYPRFGFKRAAEFGVTDARGNAHDAHMAMELLPGALSGGKFFEDHVFEDLPEAEVIAFDREFPEKAPLKKIPVSVLLDRLFPEARDAIAGLGLTWLGELRGVSRQKISELKGIDSAAIDTIRRTMDEHGRKWG